jgi:Family of unknown function (DUF5330)
LNRIRFNFTLGVSPDLNVDAVEIGCGTKSLEFTMGLLRKIIVVGGALMAMPSPPPTVQVTNTVHAAAPSSSWAYISAAADTMADVKDFCARKPQVCGTAQYLVGTLEGKAKYSAKLVYEWANESATGNPHAGNQPQNLAKADPIQTSSTNVRVASSGQENSTLKIEDLIPEWRGTIAPEKG